MALWNIVVSLEVICLTHFFQIFPDNLTWPIQKMFNFRGIKGKYTEKNELNFGINVINSLPWNLELFHNTYIFQLLQKLHDTSQVIHPVKLTVKSYLSPEKSPSWEKIHHFSYISCCTWGSILFCPLLYFNHTEVVTQRNFVKKVFSKVS